MCDLQSAIIAALRRLDFYCIAGRACERLLPSTMVRWIRGASIMRNAAEDKNARLVSEADQDGTDPSPGEPRFLSRKRDDLIARL
jgi:hypothetical protein